MAVKRAFSVPQLTPWLRARVYITLAPLLLPACFAQVVSGRVCVARRAANASSGRGELGA